MSDGEMDKYQSARKKYKGNEIEYLDVFFHDLTY